MKSIQISYELFVDLVLYHLNSEDDCEEEIRQGLEQKLDAMLNRQLYSQYKTAPTEEEREQARQEYIEGNLRLVLSVIKRFQNSSENADDLFQIGCIGLMKAIDNFDTTLMVKFSTYAVPTAYS